MKLKKPGLTQNQVHVLAVASMVITSMGAHAQSVVFDNLSQSGMINSVTVSGITAAASFTSSTVDTILSSVTVRLRGYGGTGMTTISLYSDEFLVGPSVDLFDLATFPNSTFVGDQLYSPTLLTHPTLTTASRYWLVVSSSGFIKWDSINTDAGIGVAGEYHTDASFPNSSSTNPRAFVMQVTEVPEVSATGWMTAVAAFGFATVRHWIRRG